MIVVYICLFIRDFIAVKIYPLFTFCSLNRPSTMLCAKSSILLRSII
ncbi:unnamed protein product [Schistosoma curassoni]|uniref:G-protein coupled receptors family 1 profile domain-containing protein n=1 Tax=Schistosoma curassoni TaxID=6186 RepID=A0A183JYM9_9TREM|nr:unnamed protein product [Schistosoma curassoni]